MGRFQLCTVRFTVYFSAHEQQFGTFGRPGLGGGGGGLRSSMDQRTSQGYNTRLNIQSAASAQSEESLSQPIFQTSNNMYTKQKRPSQVVR